MQKLFIKILKISIVTPEKKFGTLLKFQDGLNVIRADKSTGKTTCLNAILYALGLEKLLDREGTSILKPVLKKEVFFEGKSHSVLESFVELEIRNARNQYLTLKRGIVGEADTNIISVFHGAKLSNPREHFYQEHLYEVENRSNDPEKNLFSDMLAAFLNWKLPLLSNYQGGESPLPLECIFSMVFIDQWQGWNFDNKNLSASFGLQHPRQAAFEFIFNLDVGDIARKKRKLMEAIGELKNQWAELEDFFQAMAVEVGGKVHNFPHNPTISYDPHTPPMVMISQQQNWVSLERLVSSLKDEFSSMEGQVRHYPETQRDSSLEAEIALLEKKYAVEQVALTETRDNFFDERENVKFLQEKVSGLEKELGNLEKKIEEKETEFQLDAVFPEKFGLFGEKRSQNVGLLNSSAGIIASLKDKREKVEKQKIAAAILLEAAQSNLEETGRVFEQKNLKVSDLRKRIKLLKKSTLDREDNSRIEVKDVLRKKEKIREFESLIGKIDQKTGEIRRLSKRWKELLAEQANLRKEYHTAEDKQKLKKFLSLMIDNVRSFGFSSADSGKLKLSLETYRPGLLGMDIQHDFSASDTVRLTWAYVVALQQTQAFFACNHPQISFIDEPSQQNIRFEDKKAFYSRLNNLEPSENQIIVTTSESPLNMSQIVDPREMHFMDFKENIISPLDA